jgi:hypothetical protein
VRLERAHDVLGENRAFSHITLRGRDFRVSAE